jgi:large subunit ribosomal protein L22
MTDYKYAHEGYDAEKMARAVGRDVAISTKQAIEICSLLRKQNLQKAKQLMEDAIVKKTPVRFNRFTNGIGHRKGNIAAGAYPVKAATAILRLLKSVEVNAQNKGLNTGQLAIIHLCAHKASRPMHYGRKGRAEFKRTHVEIVVAEQRKERKAKSGKVEKHKETKVKEGKIEKQEKTVLKTGKSDKQEKPKEDKK